MAKKIVISVICLAVIFCIIFVSQAGIYLSITEKPRKSDIIVVLGGDRNGDRAEYGVKLYREKYAGRIILSGGLVYYRTTTADLMKNHVLTLGVPEKDIILEAKADSTYQQAVYIKEIMGKNRLKSAIIVSSNYHMRRVRTIFSRVFKGNGSVLTYCAANDSEFNPRRWWATNKSMMMTINEYIKLIGYLLGKAT